MDRKTKYLVILSLSLILLSPFTASANRGMINVGPKEVNLQESGQNAIVAWNGEEEVIILSTDVRSSGSTLVLEVLPLPSNPIKVTEGSFDSFIKLTGIINKKIKAIKEKGLTRGTESPDVEITFHKKIGAHDITVVKVNDIDYFINWVREFTKNKGLKYAEIPVEFKATVTSYLNRNMKFFVFDVVETGKDKQSIRPLIYRFKTDFLYYPLEITATSHARWSASSINIFLIAKGIIDRDTLESLSLLPGVGFDSNITLTKGELREVSPELEDLFKSDAFVMNASYHGSLNRLNRDLVVRHVFQDAKRIKKAMETAIEKAREFFKKGLEAKELTEKESLYVKALELWPSYPEAHNNLGDIYEKQGRYDEAIREYTLAATFTPTAPFPYFGLGDVYFKIGRYEQAAKNYEKGLKMEPNNKESQENLKIAKVLSVKILFPFGSDKLTNEANEQLNEIAEVLRPKLVPSWIDNVVFEIQGHTDSIGSENYNLHLSQRRAEGVKKYLVEKCGISAKRLMVKGYGEDRPNASNETEEGRQINRRVVIYGIGTRMGLIRVVPEKFETK